MEIPSHGILTRNESKGANQIGYIEYELNNRRSINFHECTYNLRKKLELMTSNGIWAFLCLAETQLDFSKKHKRSSRMFLRFINSSTSWKR